MNLHLYNTLIRQKEKFVPIDSDHIRLYVCGPTVNNRAHLGNARPVVIFDMLFRLLKHLYPRVTYVRNITDIDDKIIVAAAEKSISIESLTVTMTDFYHQDMDALNTLPPTIEPRATGHIDKMIAMIDLLLKEGHAYVAEGHVLFQVNSYPNYGQLSKLSSDDRVAGARVELAPYKKNPEDFILWKPSDSSQPGWQSPWGRGRPGWHIECSAMAGAYLGASFDIHGGGIDLVFPHHENEIAQTCCAYKTDSMAKIWMHNGHLKVDGEKMSKSLGNFFTVSDLLEKVPGEVIRLVFLMTHYRQPLNWTWSLVEQSKNILNKFYQALEFFDNDNYLIEFSPLDKEFIDPLLDDLNTPLAITYLHDLVKKIHQAPADRHLKKSLQVQLKYAGNFLGILNHSYETWFKTITPTQSLLIPEEIEKKIAERIKAKQEKNFQKADEIRSFLSKNGVIVEDSSAHKTNWKYV